MPIFPARFVRCKYCKRLITVDATNPLGLCTRECILQNGRILNGVVETAQPKEK